MLAMGGAAIAFLCFFLPMIVLKIVNPVAWLVGGPENITISMSGFQTMLLSSPSISGLGGLGDYTENLYNELNLGKLIVENADMGTKLLILLGRLAMFALVAATIGALVMGYKSLKSAPSAWGRWMMILGGASILTLLVSSLVIHAGFNTGSSELDALLSSTIRFSNGIGFWGMLLGFAGFTFAGYQSR